MIHQQCGYKMDSVVAVGNLFDKRTACNVVLLYLTYTWDVR
jgi:hypothetical protein